MEPGWRGGRFANGVQHTGIKFPSYCGGWGGGDSPGTGPCPTFFLIFKKSVKRTEKRSATWSVIIIVPGFANLTIHKMPTDSDVLWVSLAYKAPHRTCGRKRKLPTHTAVYGKLKVCCDPNLPKVKSS